MKAFIRIPTLAAILLCSTAVTSFAQESPAPSELMEIVKSELPPFWDLENFQVVATSDIGDAVAPRRAFRFEVVGSPATDLYAETSQEGPFVVVVPTMGSEATRTLYGVLDLGYKAGNWSGAVMIENPVSQLGQPRDLFVRPSLVAGTEETDAKLAAMKSAAVKSALATAQAEEQKIKTDLDIRLSQIKSDHAKALSKAKAEYEAELAKITVENEPLIEQAEAERAKILAEQKEKTRSEITSLKEQEAQEIEEIKQAHAEKRGKLIEKQRQELAAIETRLATEATSLQKQIDIAEEVVVLQQELKSSMEKRNLGTKEIFKAFEKGVIERTEFLNQIPKYWAGIHTCKGKANVSKHLPAFSISHPIFFRIDEVRSNGASVVMSEKKTLIGGATGSLLWKDDASVFPLNFDLVMKDNVRLDEERITYSIPVSLTQDGKLTGTAPHEIHYKSDWRIADCTIKLSS